MSDDEFQAEHQGSHTFPSQAGSLKKGDYIVINGGPCKILELTTSKTGKHGHAKANITALNIFNGKKQEESVPTSHNVDCPNVTRQEYSLISIDDNGYCTILDEKEEVQDDYVQLPKEDDAPFVKTLKERFENGEALAIITFKALGIEQVVDFKEDKK